MTTKFNNGVSDGGSRVDGAAVTTGNSGGGSAGDALDSVALAGAATLVYENTTPPLAGYMWWQFNAASGSDRVRAYHSFPASNYMSCRFYFRWLADPNAANIIWSPIDTTFATSPFDIRVDVISGTRRICAYLAGSRVMDFSGAAMVVNSIYMMDAYVVIGGTAGTGTAKAKLFDSTGTLIQEYSNVGGAALGTNLWVRSQWGGNTGVKMDMQIAGVRTNNDSPGAYQGPAGINIAPVATFMNRPAPQAAGTCTGTCVFTESDGTIANTPSAPVIEIMAAPGDGGSPPNNPTVSLGHSGLNTATCTTTYTFIGSPGRYRLHAYCYDNNGLISNDAYMYVDVYPASNTDVLPYREISGSDTNIGGASSKVAAWTDGLNTTYTETINSPVNAMEKVEWCSMGPGPITFKIGGYQNPSSPTVTVDVDVYLNNDSTVVYNGTPFNAPTAYAETTVTVDAAGEAIASVGANRAALITRITANQ